MTHTDAVQSSAGERYLLDEMSELERHAFEDHYFDCVECADEVRAGAVMREGVNTGLLSGTNVRSIASAPRRSSRATRFLRRSAILPWAAAATFAVVAGYEALQQSALPPQLAPQVLATITLRPGSRGSEAIVALPEDKSAVTLAIDVDSDDELAYELRTIQGQSVAAGPADAPPGDAPLLLLIPVWTLSPNEHYILNVRRRADGLLVDEYRFAVASR